MESGALKIFIVLFIFFYTFIGLFNIEENDFDINKYMPIKNTISDLQSYKAGLQETDDNILTKIGIGITSTISVLMIPLMLIDIIILIVSFTTLGLTSVPIMINVLIIVPLSTFIFIDYVIPLIRGN